MTIKEIEAHAEQGGRFGVYEYSSKLSGAAFMFAGAQTEQAITYFTDDEGEYVDEEAEEVQTGMVYMVMVGDDYKHVVDPDDVAPITEDAYCHECGQLGCTHDGRN